MTEAVFLPYLDLTELIKFSSLNRTCRAMVTPSHPKCVNMIKLLAPGIDPDNFEKDQLLTFI